MDKPASAAGAAAAPPMVRRVIGRYVRAFSPYRIVLFGSYAKGTARPGSDVDLLVIADCDADEAGRLRHARQLAGDCFPPIDVVFATHEEVEKAAEAKSPFLQSILEKGRTVYELDSCCQAPSPPTPMTTSRPRISEARPRTPGSQGPACSGGG